MTCAQSVVTQSHLVMPLVGTPGALIRGLIKIFPELWQVLSIVLDYVYIFSEKPGPEFPAHWKFEKGSTSEVIVYNFHPSQTI